MMTPYDRSIYYTSANMPVRCVMCECDEIITEPRTEVGYDANDEVDHWAVDAYAAKIEAARCAKEMFNTLAQAGAVLNENDFSKKGGQFNLYRRQRMHFYAQPIKESVNV